MHWVQNILVCVRQKKQHQMGLKQHENQRVVIELFLNALLNWEKTYFKIIRIEVVFLHENSL